MNHQNPQPINHDLHTTTTIDSTSGHRFKAYPNWEKHKPYLNQFQLRETKALATIDLTIIDPQTQTLPSNHSNHVSHRDLHLFEREQGLREGEIEIKV